MTSVSSTIGPDAFRDVARFFAGAFVASFAAGCTVGFFGAGLAEADRVAAGFGLDGLLRAGLGDGFRAAALVVVLEAALGVVFGAFFFSGRFAMGSKRSAGRDRYHPDGVCLERGPKRVHPRVTHVAAFQRRCTHFLEEGGLALSQS